MYFEFTHTCGATRQQIKVLSQDTLIWRRLETSARTSAQYRDKQSCSQDAPRSRDLDFNVYIHLCYG